MHADPALIRSVKARVSPEQWAMRTDLAAAYRAVAMYGWDDLVFTHISARVPGPGHHFLINPYGMMFEEITASSLVMVNLTGEKVMESPFEINPAGFTIHSAVHEAREDAACVIEAILALDWQLPDELEVAGTVLALSPEGARWEN